jgi:catecholate siderophore receptor
MSSQTPFASSARLTPIAAAVHLVVAGAFAAASTAALAQAAPETTLQEVKVIGTSESTYTVKTSSTGTKTDTLLRDTPQAITVITKELMRDQNMQNLSDVVRYVPGVVTAQGEGNRDTAVFRGNSSTGDFYVDGIRDDVQYFRDFYNIDAVEALKGSNAMIFGRGGSGGVINRVTKVAGWAPVRETSITLGQWDSRRGTVDYGHVVNDKVAVRFNGMVEKSDSYRDGVTIERSGINPTVAIRAGQNTSVVLGYERFHDDRVADRGVPSLGGRPFQTDPSAYFGNQELSPVWVRMDAFTAVLDHDFGNGLSLRNRSRYADYDKFYQNIYASGPANGNGSAAHRGTVTLGAYNNATQRTNLFNQTDLFYTLETGSVKHKLVAGLELGRQETDNLRQTGTIANARVSLANPRAAGAVPFASSATDAYNHGVATVASVYVQDQLELSPRWQVIAGVRYDRFNVDFESKNPATLAKLDVRDTPVSPRLGVVYKPFEALSLYGSYSIAYVPRAGDQLGSLTARVAAFDPEEFKNLELGAKWDIRPELAASVAVYRLDRTNVITASPTNPLENILVDGQRTEGVELSLSGKVNQAWSIMGGYAYQDAKLALIANNAALNGATLANVPKHTFSLWNRYDLDSQWAAGLGLSYRDSIYAAVDNTVTLPAYTRVDVALYYKLNKDYQLQANMENLLNKAYWASANGNNNITPGSPRALRVTLNAKF